MSSPDQDSMPVEGEATKLFRLWETTASGEPVRCVAESDSAEEIDGFPRRSDKTYRIGTGRMFYDHAAFEAWKLAHRL
jgi:hypothetical protein